MTVLLTNHSVALVISRLNLKPNDMAVVSISSSVVHNGNEHMLVLPGLISGSSLS